MFFVFVGNSVFLGLSGSPGTPRDPPGMFLDVLDFFGCLMFFYFFGGPLTQFVTLRTSQDIPGYSAASQVILENVLCFQVCFITNIKKHEIRGGSRVYLP